MPYGPHGNKRRRGRRCRASALHRERSRHLHASHTTWRNPPSSQAGVPVPPVPVVPRLSIQMVPYRFVRDGRSCGGVMVAESVRARAVRVAAGGDLPAYVYEPCRCARTPEPFRRRWPGARRCSTRSRPSRRRDPADAAALRGQLRGGLGGGLALGTGVAAGRAGGVQRTGQDRCRARADPGAGRAPAPCGEPRRAGPADRHRRPAGHGAARQPGPARRRTPAGGGQPVGVGPGRAGHLRAAAAGRRPGSPSTASTPT